MRGFFSDLLQYLHSLGIVATELSQIKYFSNHREYLVSSLLQFKMSQKLMATQSINLDEKHFCEILLLIDEILE